MQATRYLSNKAKFDTFLTLPLCTCGLSGVPRPGDRDSTGRL